MLETKIGRRDALRGVALAVWAVGLAALSFMEGIAPLPSLSAGTATLVQASPRPAPHPLATSADGLIYGVFASTPSSRRIASLDLAAAREAPGVIAIYPRERGETGPEEPAGTAALPGGLSLPTAWQQDQYALVLARTPEQASTAADLIRITYAPPSRDQGLGNTILQGRAPAAPEDCLAAWRGIGQPSNS